MIHYTYGEEIDYEFVLLKASDRQKLMYFKCGNKKLDKFIHEEINYLKILPAIKIDIFAVDLDYQKLHYNKESAEASEPEQHYYFSDCIMGEVVQHCYRISEDHALVNYIILYADKAAYRFYQRNYFLDFEVFMEKENNMEINENIPMYMKL